MEEQQKLCEHEWKDRQVPDQPLCDCIPATLLRQLAVSLAPRSLVRTAELNPTVRPGGHWEPTRCQARHRVVIVVPCRGRLTHLSTLLHYLHPVLRAQQVNYTIVVVDQRVPAIFNKAALMNVGFLYAERHQPDCIIFHDVDFIPEDGRHLYRCRDEPLHMGAFFSSSNYRIPYTWIFGGAIALRPRVFRAVNGFSNRYFGWGGEDDDMSLRVREAHLTIHRNPREVAGYRVLTHMRDRGNYQQNKTAMLQHLFHGRDPRHDGLNSIHFRLHKTRRFPLFTWLLIDILQKRDTFTTRRPADTEATTTTQATTTTSTQANTTTTSTTTTGAKSRVTT